MLRAGEGARIEGAMRNEEAVELVIDTLRELFPVKRIWLFGSRTDSEAAPESDYDFLVLIESSKLSFHRRIFEALKKLRGTGIAADLFIYTQDEFNPEDPLIANALRKGKLVYESEEVRKALA